MSSDFDFESHYDMARLIAAVSKVDENLADQLAQTDRLCNALRSEIAGMFSPAWCVAAGYPVDDNVTCTDEEHAAAELLRAKADREMTKLIAAAREVGGLTPFVFADY